MKNNNSKYLFILFLFLIINPLFGQISHEHNIVLGFLQLKDQFNLGMVFNGIQIEYRYGLKWNINDHEIMYQPKLGFGLAFKRKMIGGQIHFAPVNVSWTMPFYEKNGHTIRGGANFITDYNYQYYQLNDGTLFYTAELGFSPIIQYGYQWDNKRVNLGLQNSLFGFSSHRQGYDPYKFMFTWRDFVVEPHKNLNFGSYNRYNHTNFSVGFTPNVDKIHAIVYEFDYLGFFWGNQFHRINHNFLWRMSL